MKSFTGKFSSVRGWALLLALLLGAGMMISACGEEETPAPTTPAPPPAPAPAPTPTPTPTPEPDKPAAPANLQVTTTTSSSITWSWDPVEGAIGYNVQFGPSSAAFTDTTPAPQNTSDTSYVVSNLEGNATVHLRVRTVAGTLQEQVIGDWSDARPGTTAPPPLAARLGPPSDFRSTEERDDSITLVWSSVDGAASYQVEQQGETGGWVAASCDGGDNEVDVTSCVASGLDEATAYNFRVRAISSDATQNRDSDWRTLSEIRTTGTRPVPPPMTVPGSIDHLNLIWESTATSITWRWDQVADRDRMYQIHYSEVAYSAKPNPCIEPDDSSWASADAAGFATSYKTDTTGVTTFSPDLEAGDVALLCVQTTWEDERGVTQYGNHSFAWAATTPAVPSLATTPYEDKDGDTRAIYWQGVTFDRGFQYELRLVSASPVEDTSAGTTSAAAAPDQAGCKAGNPLPGENSGSRAEFAFTAYDVTGLDDYTSYHLCYMARNEGRHFRFRVGDLLQRRHHAAVPAREHWRCSVNR